MIRGDCKLANKKQKQSTASLVIIIAIIIMIAAALGDMVDKYGSGDIKNVYNDIIVKDDALRIIASQENEDLGPVIDQFAKDNDLSISVDYAGTLEIMEKLNQGEKYDAVWTSNAIWIYMLDSSIKVTNSESTSINPVIFAVKESKAKELGFIGREISTKDIVDAIQNGSLKFSMSNPTQTNTGATAYLGLLSYIAGNPEVLKEQDLERQEVKDGLKSLFTGMERSSGSEEFLEEMFINGDYEAVVTYESSIINMNKKLVANGEEPLYALYPTDGVSVSDSPLAYIDNKNEAKQAMFEKLQTYILSNEGQKELAAHGRRTWFGGINENVDKTVFNPDWGIDTTKYIVPIKFPNKTIIQKALAMYQSEFRKPTNIVFCLDYSGSMKGDGYNQLMDAMDYILDETKASRDLLQFTANDRITVISFSTYPNEPWRCTNGADTAELLSKIKAKSPNGSTNIYDTSINALKELENVDTNAYNTSIVLMTDGRSNVGKYEDLEKYYKNNNSTIPIYSILFGNAKKDQLDDIAILTNGKVFDGRTDLLKAFKEVRGYN